MTECTPTPRPESSGKDYTSPLSTSSNHPIPTNRRDRRRRRSAPDGNRSQPPSVDTPQQNNRGAGSDETGNKPRSGRGARARRQRPLLDALRQSGLRPITPQQSLRSRTCGLRPSTIDPAAATLRPADHSLSQGLRPPADSSRRSPPLPFLREHAHLVVSPPVLPTATPAGLPPIGQRENAAAVSRAQDVGELPPLRWI